MHRQPVSSNDKQGEQNQDQSGTDKAQFLADNGKNEVVVLLRQIKVFLSALTETKTEQSSASDSIERLDYLVASIARIGKWVPPC